MLRGVSAFDPIFREPKVLLSSNCLLFSKARREKDLIWFEPKRVQQFLKPSGDLLPLFSPRLRGATGFLRGLRVDFAFDFPLCSSVVKVLEGGSATLWPLYYYP
jgi:hypothetical protein